MDVLLINPKNTYKAAFDKMPPLGLSFMGSYLVKHGLKAGILDLELKEDPFDLENYIKNISPLIIGISGTTHTRFESFKIARTAKKVSENIVTVYGGVHASFTSEDTLTRIKDIDFIVRGEGEETLLELSRYLLDGKTDFTSIKGISYRIGNNVIHTPPRERIKDLDIIPFSRDLLAMDKYNTQLDYLNIPATPIMTSRGCPYDCYFCSGCTIFRSGYTTRSAGNIVNEIRYLQDRYDVKGIKIFDSTFSLKRRHVMAFTDELERRNIDIPWECQIRADNVDRPFLDRIKKAGCYYVDFGLESVSPRTMRLIGKSIPLEQSLRVLKWCKELGIETKVFFSIGHMGESLKEIHQTLSFMSRYFHMISRPALTTVIRVYPGTRLEKMAWDKGLLPPDFSWSEPMDKIKGVPERGNVPIVVYPPMDLKKLNKVNDYADFIQKRNYFKRNIRKTWQETRSLRAVYRYIRDRVSEGLKATLKALPNPF